MDFMSDEFNEKFDDFVEFFYKWRKLNYEDRSGRNMFINKGIQLMEMYLNEKEIAAGNDDNTLDEEESEKKKPWWRR